MAKIWARIADYIRETDKRLLFLCIFATCLGCVAVLSATRYTLSARYFIMQTVSMLLGICAAIFISLFDYETLLKRWYIIGGAGLFLVLLTFIFGTGPAGTDDKAWLNLGFTTFQPSELLKVCFIITFAYHLSKVADKINKIEHLIPVCIHAGIPVVLIHFQGDDGTALVFAAMSLCMMWAAGVNKKYFLILLAVLVVAAPFIYFFIMNADQQARIRLLFDLDADLQGDGWQQWRGRIALAGGGFFGQGLFKGPLTQMGPLGVPEGYNDFIFVTIGEEWVFLGCIAVVTLLVLICVRCISIAKQTRKLSGKLICVGFFGLLLAQIIINLGMCLSILPVIGITLPFFSAGGTSLACLYIGVGELLSVYIHRNSRMLYLHE